MFDHHHHHILFFGATGYIGGTVFSKLLSHPKADGFKITALVRDAAKAEKLTRTVGNVENIVVHRGSNGDLDLLTKLAKEADVVFSVADTVDVQAKRAILAGSEARFEETGRPVVVIHTSGAGAIADCTVNGGHTSSLVFDDLDDAQMSAIQPTQIHRAVDLEFLAADEQGYIKSYIILPTTVYGIPHGLLVNAGIQNRQNSVLSYLVSLSMTRGQGGMVGQGKNMWHNVELNELGDLFMVLFDAAISNPDSTPHGQSGLYFAENGSHVLEDLCAVISQVLYEHGKGQAPAPTSFSEEELDAAEWGFLAALIGSDARCRARKGRALGWKPTKTTADFLENARAVTERLLMNGYV
ncbi:unnamed protein product [Mycena citricolor]|uniref:NmrA-like domain-containing protein n=1 Tax=Mycena citricolor TaxID=2018698 RepID=A0AAD2Q4U3_9AGAR|nr:unnamed protein product [Mycena citricolor]